MFPTPEQSELGKISDYASSYNPDLLFPISRKTKRDEIGIIGKLPFFGVDLWNHYEVSWLNPKGKPIVALAEIIYDCTSENIIESKSMKLYFNSFNNTSFDNVESVTNTIKNDLSVRVGSQVTVKIFPLNLLRNEIMTTGMDGICLDELDIDCSIYQVEPNFLKIENEFVAERLYSDLLKSNCLVTHQPDWASVQIDYRGKKIQHAGLLQYIVSFRNHNEFHEQCIEKMFMDIMRYCQPEELTIYGRYTRRGGLDINPIRSTKKSPELQNIRLWRQ